MLYFLIKGSTSLEVLKLSLGCYILNFASSSTSGHDEETRIILPDIPASDCIRSARPHRFPRLECAALLAPLGFNGLADLPLEVQIGWLSGALMVSLLIAFLIGKTRDEESAWTLIVTSLIAFLVITVALPAATPLRGDGILLTNTLRVEDIEYNGRCCTTT